MEAETRSVLRVPACAPGPAPAIWATQVAYVVHPGCLRAVSSASECHPAIRTVLRGGCYIWRGTVTCDQKLFSCGFLCCTIHTASTACWAPTINASYFIYGRSVIMDHEFPRGGFFPFCISNIYKENTTLYGTVSYSAAHHYCIELGRYRTTKRRTIVYSIYTQYTDARLLRLRDLPVNGKQ